MEMLSDFFGAAWSWIAMGILLAIFIAFFHAKKPKD